MFCSSFFITCFLPFSPLFLYGFLYHFLSFPAFHAFSIYFSKSFTRLLQFPIVFCTISSGCYRIFLHFHCIFSSMFTASSQFVPSSRSGFLHVPTDFAPFMVVITFFLPGCYHIFLHCIFPAFSSGFCTISSDCYHVFLQFSISSSWVFQSIHAFLIYFSKIFTRLLFAPFPLVCCIFNVFFQEFYPSPSFSDRFCTIFLLVVIAFSCTFTVFFQHVYCIVISLFLAVTPVSSMFQQILHGLFLAFSSDRYHVFLKFHCIFQYILFVGFQICFVQHFFTTCFLSISPLPSIGFCTISSGFLHFHTYLFNININPRVLPVSFIFPILFAPFPLVVITFSCTFTVFFQHVYCIVMVCGLAFAPAFLHFPRDFPWFVPSIRSVFVRFLRGFCTISSDRYHVFLQFHCIFRYILMVSPATKKADLGGIDTPPSANCLVVHNPAKCSVFSRSTQGHGEISFPFGNHPPPHPLFSLRSQTATSQLAGFRNIRTQRKCPTGMLSKVNNMVQCVALVKLSTEHKCSAGCVFGTSSQPSAAVQKHTNRQEKSGRGQWNNDSDACIAQPLFRSGNPDPWNARYMRDPSSPFL